MMSGTTIVLILCAVALSAAGQLLLKSGAQQLIGLDRVELLLAVPRNLQVMTGLSAWTASTLCWLDVLRVASLSRVYGVTSLTYVIVPIASVYLFGEQLRRVQVVGIALILMGVVCVLSGD